MHSLVFLKDDLATVESFLRLNPFNSLQRSDRKIEEIFLLHAIHLEVAERKIEGFMWAPDKADLYYEIDLSRKGVPMLEIILGSGDVDADIARVVAEIPNLRDTAGIRRAAMGKPGGGGKGKKGFYLHVGTAKAQALANFGIAAQNGIGSNDFVEFCVPRDFKMIHYKG